MRRLLMSVLGLGVLASGVGLQAQSAGAPMLPTVPTTKVLAIGHLIVERSALGGIIQQEVRETVKLYLGGKIDQWYVRADGKGVVFVMNVTTVEEAHALLEKLPMGVEKKMEFDFIPLGPLSPLGVLLRDPSAAAAGVKP